MANDDDTKHEDQTTGEETGSSSSTSTGRDTPAPEEARQYSEATLDILDDDEKITLGLMPDPDAEDDPDDDAAAGRDGEDDDPANPDGEDTAPAEAAEDSVAAEAEDTVAAEADDKVDPDAEPDLPPAVDDTEVKRLDAEMKQALKDLRDGEITEDEYEEKTTALQHDRDTAVRELGRAEAAKEGWYKRWHGEVRDYQKSVPELFEGDHRERYDAFVRQVNADPRPEIRALSMRQKLERAHRLYEADADIYKTTVPAVPGGKKPAAKADPKPTAEQKPGKPEKDEAQKRADAADKADPPQTLAKMPSAAAPDEGEGRFARLKQLENDADPEKLEAEIARLKRTDPEGYEAYMESA